MCIRDSFYSMCFVYFKLSRCIYHVISHLSVMCALDMHLPNKRQVTYLHTPLSIIEPGFPRSDALSSAQPTVLEHFYLLLTVFLLLKSYVFHRDSQIV